MPENVHSDINPLSFCDLEKINTMSTFRKSSACPQSHDLLAFQAGRLATPECESVSAHIHKCEFCAAEVDFYAHHPQNDETVERAEIPLIEGYGAKFYLTTANFIDRLAILFVNHTTFDFQRRRHFTFVDREFPCQQIDAFNAFVIIHFPG